jgi:hypothetical protein
MTNPNAAQTKGDKMKTAITYTFPSENPTDSPFRTENPAAGKMIEAVDASEHFIIHPAMGSKGLSLTHKVTGLRVTSASAKSKAKYLHAVARGLEATGMPWDGDSEKIYYASTNHPCRNWMIELSKSIL